MSAIFVVGNGLSFVLMETDFCTDQSILQKNIGFLLLSCINNTSFCFLHKPFVLFIVSTNLSYILNFTGK